jgi:hypothetical protein
MAKVVFRSDLFVVTEAPRSQELYVEFLGGQGLNLVPTRFLLLPSERHLCSSVRKTTTTLHSTWPVSGTIRTE